MKTVSVDAELRALLTILDGPEDCSSYLLGRIRNAVLNTKGEITEDGHFGWAPCVEVFTRISTLFRRQKQIPNADLFKEDPSISDDAKELLSGEADVIEEMDQAEALLDTLEAYRKIRVLHRSMKTTTRYLNKTNDPKDIESALRMVESGLVDAKTRDRIDITRTGAHDTSKKTVVKIIEVDKTEKLKTGITQFDRRTGGIRRKNLWLMAGPTGGGKSAMALQIALNMHAKFHYNVAFVSFEMDGEEIYGRLLANIAKVNHGKLDNKKLSIRQKSRVFRAWKKFKWIGKKHNCQFDIWAPEGEFSATQICNFLRPFKYDVIIVDYINLVAPEGARKGAAETEAQQLGLTAKTFKLAGNTLNAAVIVLAQFDEKKKQVRYARAMREHANLMWEWNYGDKEREIGEVLIRQSKARNAPIYTFPMEPRFKYMRWENVEVREDLPGKDVSEKQQKALDQMTGMSEVPVIEMDDDDE